MQPNGKKNSGPRYPIFPARWLLLLGLLLLPHPVRGAPCQYTVRPGQSLAAIATVTGTTVEGWIEANPSLAAVAVPRRGQRLHLPGCAATSQRALPTPTPEPTPSASSTLVAAPSLALSLRRELERAAVSLRYPVDGPTNFGSGIVVGGDGRTVLTAYHVVADPLNGVEADTIEVGLGGDWGYTAEIVARDVALDLAVLRIREEVPRELVPARLAPGGARVGEPLYTVSYFEESERLVVGEGHYLSQTRTFHHAPDLIVTDAVSRFGSSGGAVVNGRGEVVGIITAAVYGEAALELLGYPELEWATLVVPLDVATDFLEEAGLP